MDTFFRHTAIKRLPNTAKIRGPCSSRSRDRLFHHSMIHLSDRPRRGTTGRDTHTCAIQPHSLVWAVPRIGWCQEILSLTLASSPSSPEFGTNELYRPASLRPSAGAKAPVGLDAGSEPGIRKRNAILQTNFGNRYPYGLKI